MTAPEPPASAGYASEYPSGAGSSSAAERESRGRVKRSAAGTVNARQALAAAMTEAELEEHVRAICVDLGILRIHVYNSRGTTAGVPDDILIGPRGILWRELKTMRGKLTPAQQEMGHALTVAGQDYGVWRPSLLLAGVIARELAAISRLAGAA